MSAPNRDQLDGALGAIGRAMYGARWEEMTRPKRSIRRAVTNAASALVSVALSLAVVAILAALAVAAWRWAL